MKKLFTSLVALVALFSISSCLQEERSPEEILIPSPAKVDCSDESLKLTSKVPSGSEKLVDECGFYYGKDESLADATKIAGSMEVNEFAIDLPERNYGTTYYICSYVTNGHGSEIRSAISSYNLKPLKEYIEFEPVELLSYSKAARKADVAFSADIWNGVSVSQTGVCFGVTTSPSEDGRHQEGTLSEEGVVTVTLSNFDVDTQYYLRAYVKDGEYTAYGEVIPLIIKLTPPTLSSVIVSSVESNSALFSSSVTSNGGDPVSEVGFYYSTDEAVDVETATKVNEPYSEASFDLQANELTANTKYYVKAYAVNSAGVGYSQTTDFTTSAGAPSVTTLGATDVTSTGATLSGTIIADNGAAITERGFVWMQGTGTPTTDSFKLKVDGTTGEFTSILTGLEPNQKYSFRAYAINPKGTSYGDVMTFTTGISLASLTSVTVSSITSTSAILSSKVSSHGGETVSEVGFYYSTDAAVDLAKSQKVNRTYSSDSFSISISELSINTKYYVKAYAVNSAGTVYSEIESFTTLASTPVVTTVGSSDVTSVSAVLSGKVVTDNGAAITERGFVWLKGSDAPTTSSNKLKVDGTTGDFTSTLDGLEPNQKFSFRAYAINSKGTAYGDIMHFTTVAGLPTLSAMKISDITTTSATFTCAVTGHGGDIVSEVGFYIGKEENVDIETALKISEAYTSDSFTLTATDLEVGTDYYVKAFTKNSVGESYSVIASFKTVSTAPSVTTVGSSEITDSSVLLSGDVTDDNGEDITERGFVWLKGTGTPTTSNSKLRSDGTTGEYSATLSALEPNQTYSFRSYAVNAKGTAYGETMTFRTEVALPEVVFVNYSDVASSSAIVSGKVTSHGGETVSEVGFLYGTTSELDSATSLKVTTSYTGDSFSLTLTSLTRATEYYIKPFVTNSAGTAYGEVTSFTTLPELPVVTTNHITDITDNGAVSGGVIVDDGDGDIIAKGVVWSRSKNPTVEASFKTEDGTGSGSFTSHLSDLFSGSTYYVRAYATNSVGTSYGDQYEFRTEVAPPEVVFVSCSDVTSSSAIVSGKVTSHGGETVSEVGFLYGTTSNLDSTTSLKVTTSYTGDSFSLTLTSLTRATEHYVQPFAKNSAGTAYGEVTSFTTLPELPVVTTNHITDITDNSAVSGGVIVDDGGGDIIAKGVVWSRSKNPTVEDSFKTEDGTGSGSYTSYLTDLTPGRTYYVRAYATNLVGTSYGEELQFTVAGELQAIPLQAANCFIISSPEVYSFKTVKGNSSESVGIVSSAEVLWESYGTSETPVVGSLVSSVSAQGDMIVFEVPEPYREGNSVIAAKDAAGTILWSWHIWLTDEPKEQIYNNNAGTMMDRNLGATSATPGDVGALGLLYQWGRKDPFLGSSSISSGTEALSTLSWPSTVTSNSTNGTIEYAVQHPTTFIGSNYDWHYYSRDNTLWQSEKTIYDPCPVGWRVPDGGSNGVWKVAGFSDRTYDDTNEGISFSISSPSTTWYPASGYRYNYNGSLYYVGDSGYYWSVSPTSNDAYYLYFNYNGNVDPTYDYNYRARGYSVRCLQESE